MVLVLIYIYNCTLHLTLSSFEWFRLEYRIRENKLNNYIIVYAYDID